MSQPTISAPIHSMGILLFHGVVSSPPPGLARRERKYWMDTATFRHHLGVLAGSKHPVARLEDCWQARKIGPLVPSLLDCPSNPSPVVLTFDDGWQSDFSFVWPLLIEAGFPATFFVNTASLGKRGRLRWSQVRQMCAQGASFQSHGHHHTDLTRLGTQTLRTELRMSKDLLEGWVNRPVEFLAVPYGRVSRRVVDAALEAGYRAVCTSEPRPATPGTERVSRVAIHARTKPGEVARLISGRRIPYWTRQARSALLAPAKLFLHPTSHERELLVEVAR